MDNFIVYDGSVNYYNCIYMYINTINNKKYIGQAKDFKSRYDGHYYDSFNSRRADYTRPFHNAIRKYGIDNFNIFILKYNLKDQDEMNYWERYYIKEFDVLVKNNKGYNVADGGSNGCPLSGKTEEELKEIRLKQSIALSGENNPFYGKHHSEETINKIKEANKNREIKPVTEETRIKQASHRGKGKVCQFTKDGVFVKQWDYISQISRETGFCRSAISNCCRGDKGCSNNYLWIYLKDLEAMNEEEFKEWVIKCNTKNYKAPNKKRVGKYSKDGILLKEYNSIDEASKDVGCTGSNITLVCQGVNKTAKGFIWKYLD